MRFSVVRATALAVCASLVASSSPLEAWAQMGKLAPVGEPLPLPEAPLVIESGVSAAAQSLAPSIEPLAQLSTLPPLDAVAPALVRDARKVAASTSKALNAGSLELAVSRLGAFDRTRASLHSAPDAPEAAIEKPGDGGLSGWIKTALNVEADGLKAAEWPAEAARLLRSDPSMPLEKAVAKAAGRAFGLNEQDVQFLELSLRGGGRIRYNGPDGLPAINMLRIESGSLEAHTEEGVFRQEDAGWRKLAGQRSGWPEQQWGRLFVVQRDAAAEYAVADGDLYAKREGRWAPAVEGGKTASSELGSSVLVTLPPGLDSLAAVDRSRTLLIRSASSGSELDKERHRPDLILPEGIWSWSPAPSGWREALLARLASAPAAKPASVGVKGEPGRIVDGRRRTIFGGLTPGLGLGYRDDGRDDIPWGLVFLTALTTVLGAKALAALSAAYLAAALATALLGPSRGWLASYFGAALAGLSLATLGGLVTTDPDLYTAFSVVPSIFSVILFANHFERWRAYRAELLALKPEGADPKLQAWARNLAATQSRRQAALEALAADAGSSPLVPMMARIAERDPDKTVRLAALDALAPHVRSSLAARRALRRAADGPDFVVRNRARELLAKAARDAKRELDAQREVRRLMGSAPPADRDATPGVTGEAGEILDGRSRTIFDGLAAAFGSGFSAADRVYPPLSGLAWLGVLAVLPWIAAWYGTPALVAVTAGYGLVSLVMGLWWAIVPERSPSTLRLMGSAALSGLAAIGFVSGPIAGAGIPAALTAAGLVLGDGMLFPRLSLPFELREARPDLGSVPEARRVAAAELADALEDPRRRDEGLSAAGKSSAGAHVVEMLLRLAKDDPKALRRKAALLALASLAPDWPSALEAVEELSRRRWDGSGSKEAAKALRRIQRARKRQAAERVVAEAMGPAPDARSAAPSAPIASEDGLLSGRDGRALFGGLATRLAADFGDGAEPVWDSLADWSALALGKRPAAEAVRSWRDETARLIRARPDLPVERALADGLARVLRLEPSVRDRIHDLFALGRVRPVETPPGTWGAAVEGSRLFVASMSGLDSISESDRSRLEGRSFFVERLGGELFAAVENALYAWHAPGWEPLFQAERAWETVFTAAKFGNRLFVGTMDNLYEKQGRSWVPLLQPRTRVNHIALIDGRLHVSTNLGLYVQNKSGEWRELGPGHHGGGVWIEFVGKIGGKLAVGYGRRGVFTLEEGIDGKTPEEVEPQPQWTGEDGRVRMSAGADRDRRHWAQDDGIPPSEDLKLFEHRGRTLLAGSEGLFERTGSDWKRLVDPKDGAGEVRGLLESPEGDLLVAEHGVFRIVPPPADLTPDWRQRALESLGARLEAAEPSRDAPLSDSGDGGIERGGRSVFSGLSDLAARLHRASDPRRP